jgi:hypothetical protein
MGLMSSTPNNILAVRNGIAPLAKRFVYLETLGELNIGRCITGYPDILTLDIISSVSFTIFADIQVC